MKPVEINEVDRVEILTLQDNYIDMVAFDNNQVVRRALPFKENELRLSLLAEHGFSALFTVTKGTRSESILFDFGFSDHGAAFNVDVLGVDLGS